MLLKVETIEKVQGSSIQEFWTAPMYIVNGEFLASSIDRHNIQGKPFDLKEGETVEVLTKPDSQSDRFTWIARKYTQTK